jgi:hypothetical protein
MCQLCNQGHRRHGSVASVQAVRPMRRAVLLIIRRSWVRAPPAPPAVLIPVVGEPWTGLYTDVGGAMFEPSGLIWSHRVAVERVWRAEADGGVVGGVLQDTLASGGRTLVVIGLAAAVAGALGLWGTVLAEGTGVTGYLTIP